MARFDFEVAQTNLEIDQAQLNERGREEYSNNETFTFLFPNLNDEVNPVDRVIDITNTGSTKVNFIELTTPLTGLQTGRSWSGKATFNLADNTHVNLAIINNSVLDANLEVNLSAGATLELDNPFMGQTNNSLESFKVNMGSEGNSTLIIDDDPSKDNIINMELSGFSDGDQIIVSKIGNQTIDPNVVFSNGSISEDNLISGTLTFNKLTSIGPRITAQFKIVDLKLPDDYDFTDFNIENFDASEIFNVDPETGVISYACFLKGTKIATPEGEVKVEDLKAGDQVLTASGDVATVKWLGFRKLYRNRIPAADAVRAFPILIKKDAIADNVPHADLTVSPGHHLYFDGLLIPAMMLVNGQTITQQFNTPSFEYYHVELEEFDILLAENVPAESYVDTGNRSMFQNAKEVDLNPDFGPAEGRPEVEGITVAREGALVEAVRKQLLARAEQMTGARRTKDAELRIEVDGQVIEATPEFVKEGVYSFELPANAGDIRILSRSATVRDVTPLARRDIRQVGVGLSAIAIVDAQGRRELDLNAESLTGLNAAQDVRGTLMRWTTGEAVVPASEHQASAKATLELTVLRTYTYWVDSVTQNATKVA